MGTLSQYNRPGSRLDRSRSSNYLNDFFSEFEQMFDTFSGTNLSSNRNFMPACDIKETKEHFLLSFDMPGVKKDDIKVEINNNQLLISGTRDRSSEESDDQGVLRTERSFGQFQRSFSLPATVNVDDIEAHYEDGVLNIGLPKSETAKSRNIQVKSGETNLFQRLLGKDKKQDEKDMKNVKVS